MRCEDCPRWNADEQACRDRKLNPGSFGEAVEVVQMFGPRALCTMNDYRERMLDICKGALLPGKPPRRR